MEAPGLLKHYSNKSKMEWSSKNLLAIHLNSFIYFYKENQKIADSIDLNKQNNGFDENYLIDMKFNPQGSKLLFIDKNNLISLYDIGK